MVREFNIARALTWRYIIALSLIASLSTAAWFSLHMVISAQKSTAAVVNISGRQRMLSQRTAFFSNFLVGAPRAERPSIRNKLKDAVQLMEHSHHGLIHGDIKMGLPETMSPTVQAMYFDGQNALDGQVETYIKNVNELLLLDDSKLTTANPQLLYITKNAPTTLVAALDKMVSQYQTEGEESVSRLQKVETIFWAITLFLLALEAVLIFRPFVKHIRAVLERLHSINDELQIHKDQLDKIVAQRTEELEKKSDALRKSEERWKFALEGAGDGVWDWNYQTGEALFSPRYKELLGFTDSESWTHASEWEKRVHPDDLPTVIDALQKHMDGKTTSAEIEFRMLCKDGSWKWMMGRGMVVSRDSDGKPLRLVGTNTDITARKQMEIQVRQLAYFDALTQLPNRRMLDDRLTQAMAQSKRSSRYGAIMFIDMDNFKPLNDQFGHDVGDLLLVEVARRLTRLIREMDTVARFGGDEFVVMLSELEEDKSEAISHIRIVAEKIMGTLSEAYEIALPEGIGTRSITHCCTASIGVALFIDHEASKEELIKWADIAMYQAKEAGGNQIRFYENQF
jgi:diguanylate cyclase (GGDEF)-like protein/PAS domain S-box-containing protein